MSSSNYKIFAVIIENGVDINSLVIQSISKVSAEDRARRFFRKAGVPMSKVDRVVVDETEANWTGYAGNLPMTEDQVLEAAANVFTAAQPFLAESYTNWQASKNQDEFDTLFRPSLAAVVDGTRAKFINFTSRPFVLTFKVQRTIFTIGRNKSAGFELRKDLINSDNS